MILNTKYFDTVDIKEEDIITFEKGLPGFENNKRFVILYKLDSDNPFKWLQSVDNGSLTFVIIQPQVFKDKFEVKIDDNTASELEMGDISDIVVYSIVTIPDDTSMMTANLRAPVLINAKKNKGRQIVLDDERYSFKHSILQELQNMGGK